MPVKFQDYYETLGVKRDASQADIQRAYRGLARKYHPDVNKEPSAAEKFKQIGEAYEVLKDPEKRKKYDRLGADWKNGQEFTPPPGWGNFNFQGGGPRGRGGGGGGFSFQPGGQFSDFFEMFFGGETSVEDMFHQQRGGARSAPRQQPMQESELTISLEEAHRGTTRQLQMQGPGGTKRIDVKIPAGVAPGTKMRLKDQGVVLKINIAPHARFSVEGKNLAVTLPIAPWQAALGAKVPVQTLDGEVTLTIPPCTSSGAKLRLKNKGLKGGDLIARIKIELPKTLTEEQRKLYEQLKNESSA